MKEEKKVDYLYRDNKYVSSDEIKFDKKYLRKVRINRFINFLVFLVVLGICGYGAKVILSPVIQYDGVVYEYENTRNLEIGDTILYTNEDKTPIDKILILLGHKSFCVAEITKLPMGITTVDDKQILLENNQYATKCIKGYCKPDSNKIILYEKIYGKVKK